MKKILFLLVLSCLTILEILQAQKHIECTEEFADLLRRNDINYRQEYEQVYEQNLTAVIAFHSEVPMIAHGHVVKLCSHVESMIKFTRMSLECLSITSIDIIMLANAQPKSTDTLITCPNLQSHSIRLITLQTHQTFLSLHKLIQAPDLFIYLQPEHLLHHTPQMPTKHTSHHQKELGITIPAMLGLGKHNLLLYYDITATLQAGIPTSNTTTTIHSTSTPISRSFLNHQYQYISSYDQIIFLTSSLQTQFQSFLHHFYFVLSKHPQDTAHISTPRNLPLDEIPLISSLIRSPPATAPTTAAAAAEISSMVWEKMVLESNLLKERILSLLLSYEYRQFIKRHIEDYRMVSHQSIHDHSMVFATNTHSPHASTGHKSDAGGSGSGGGVGGNAGGASAQPTLYTVPSHYTSHVAVLMEARLDCLALEYTLHNMIYYVTHYYSTDDWNIRIYHTSENHEYLLALLAMHFQYYANMITLHLLPSPFSDSGDYNQFLKTANPFWKELYDAHYEYVLFFQLDSLFIGSPQTDTVDNVNNVETRVSTWKSFFVYDYLGAPWCLETGPGITSNDWLLAKQQKGEFVTGVGNGGLSLRKVSTMYAITKQYRSANRNVNEDYYFIMYLETMNGSVSPVESNVLTKKNTKEIVKMPSRSIAALFAQEMPCTDFQSSNSGGGNSVGIHAMWNYVNVTRARELLALSLPMK